MDSSDLTQNSGNYYAGDAFSVTVTGPPNQQVTVSVNGVAAVPAVNAQGSSTTSARGVWTTSGVWSASNVGSYTQTWYVGGLSIPGISFQVQVAIARPEGACGGFTNSLFTFTQGTPTVVVLVVGEVGSPSLTINLLDASGSSAGTPINASQVPGTMEFVATLRSSTLGLGVTQLEAWMSNADGSNRQYCDTAFALQLAAAPSPSIGSCGTANGNWTLNVMDDKGDLTNSGPLSIGQSSADSFSATLPVGNSCGPGTVTWPVTDQYTPNPNLNTDGTLSINASSPNPTKVGSCSVATSIQMTGTIPYLQCNSASGAATITIPGQPVPTQPNGTFSMTKGCDVPTGETTAWDQWQSGSGQSTMAGFSATLQPSSINFAGRILRESGTATVNDSCFFQCPPIGKTSLSSIWPITSSNAYSVDDEIGYSPAAVLYYRQYMYRQGKSGAGLSCGFTAKQQMSINSCGSSTVFNPPYGATNSGNTNDISSTITSTTVTSTRANVSAPTLTFP